TMDTWRPADNQPEPMDVLEAGGCSSLHFAKRLCFKDARRAPHALGSQAAPRRKAGAKRTDGCFSSDPPRAGRSRKRGSKACAYLGREAALSPIAEGPLPSLVRPL